MLSRDDHLDLLALTYLVTAVIHRFHEIDGNWWEDFREEMQGQMDTACVSGQEDHEKGSEPRLICAPRRVTF